MPCFSYLVLNLTDGDQIGAENIMRFFNLNLWFNSLASLAVQVFEYFVDNFCFHLGPVQIPVGVKVLRKFEHLFGL